MVLGPKQTTKQSKACLNLWYKSIIIYQFFNVYATKGTVTFLYLHFFLLQQRQLARTIWSSTVFLNFFALSEPLLSYLVASLDAKKVTKGFVK